MGRIVLVLGGIKTGKTRFAQNRAAAYDRKGEDVVYLATAQAFDEEMEDRIARHKKDRPSRWLTVEEPLNIARAYKTHAGGRGVVLLDCLTLWMTNTMAAHIPPEAGTGGLPDKDRTWHAFTEELDALLEAVEKGEKDIVIISNQVEYGLVSEYAFARMYQDLAGLTHQYLAARSHEVYSLIAGIAQCLKNKE